MESFFNEIDHEGNINIKSELLSIRAFADIWDSDKKKDKLEARRKITYVWGMCSLNEAICDYANIVDFDERSKALQHDIWGKDIKYNPTTDPLLIACIKQFRERYPKNNYDIQADFKAVQIERVRKYLANFNLGEKNENGVLVLKPADFQKAMSELDVMVKALEEMRELAKEKRNRDSNIRGGGTQGLFEDPTAVSYLNT